MTKRTILIKHKKRQRALKIFKLWKKVILYSPIVVWCITDIHYCVRNDLVALFVAAGYHITSLIFYGLGIFFYYSTKEHSKNTTNALEVAYCTWYTYFVILLATASYIYVVHNFSDITLC